MAVRAASWVGVEAEAVASTETPPPAVCASFRLFFSSLLFFDAEARPALVAVTLICEGWSPSAMDTPEMKSLISAPIFVALVEKEA